MSLSVSILIVAKPFVTTAIAVTLYELGGFIIQYRNIVNKWLYFFMYRTMDHGTTEIYTRAESI